MCLAMVAFDAHPAYSLVIAANRDEYHARAAEPAHWWPAGLLGGRDLAAGGTWLGITRSGRWAFVTNVREPRRFDPQAPSRGDLVPEVLGSPQPLVASLAAVASETLAYNGYNLLAGDCASAYWLSNRVPGVHALEPGVHGLSNAALDTPWPKVSRVRDAVSRWCREGERALDALFPVLADRCQAPDAELPVTGIHLERERLLSAPFIVSPLYGTRCSTILALTRDGEATLVERSFDAQGLPLGEVRETFRVEGGDAAPAAALHSSGRSIA